MLRSARTPIARARKEVIPNVSEGPGRLGGALPEAISPCCATPAPPRARARKEVIPNVSEGPGRVGGALAEAISPCCATPAHPGPSLTFGMTRPSERLVRRRSVDRRHCRVVQAEVDRQLPAVMGEVVGHRVAQGDITRDLPDEVAADQKLPPLRHGHVG